MMKLFRRSKKSKSDKSQAAFNYDRDPRFPPVADDHGPYDSYHKKNGHSLGSNAGGGYAYQKDTHFRAEPINNGVFAPWLELPTPILQRVFAFVCPHCRDESYETCEQSALEDACMLCDVRDLSHAGMVCKEWRKAAIPMMYHSIRIDSVHYCEREIYLSDKRKRRTRFDRNGVPEDTASARLQLLCRSLREDPTRLGKMVQYFKTPYMLRESKTADLARTIAVLPNLRYLDLPEGVSVGDPAYATLTLEIQARCPDLRKMSYIGGSERNLEALASGTVWTKLEVLELGRINMDPQILRHVLSTMQFLRALKVSESRVIDDDIFKHNDVLPPLPALEELILKETPRVTSGGLVAYLSRQDVQWRLKVLSLHDTGVHPQALQDVLANAPNLQTLSLIDEVDTAFPMSTSAPPLANFSLRTLRYEITASPNTSPYVGMTQGYYNYLAQSLFAGGFPSLVSLYVRDDNFPDLLLGLPPPMPGYAGSPQRPGSSGSMGIFSMGSSPSLSPTSTGGYPAPNHGNLAPFGGGNTNRFSSNNPFANAQKSFGAAGNGLGPPMLTLNQTLAVYTKGDDDNDWGLIKMDPYDNPGYAGGRGVGSGPRHGRSSSTNTENRPLSSYGLADVGSGWREGSGGARKSIMVGNGAGGFLAVPSGNEGPFPRRRSEGMGADEWPRPMSSQGIKGDKDLWR
ncbi:hypothetical protein SUNI508_09672 [Seiridium unicorne]|uniref:F-box domain-containing protein n=1 Tax=Seiridium unicorne TaxID=138068 RepID=A0ABR2UPU3_9PEZI